MIKILNSERYPYLEMARVGTTENNLDIIIRTDDPGKIPHFHIIDKSDDKDNEGCIKILVPEYFDHGSKNMHLNSSQRKELVRFLRSKHKKLNITNWEYLIILWNDNNSDVIIDDELEMPDYSKLR